jgi:hypothetical protein
MSCGESDSDTDSVNEFQVKKFLFKSFKERIQQAKAQCEKNTKSGVKRQPGHYHLRDSRRADLLSFRSLYNGRHWDIEEPAQLQRSTRRLTRFGIMKALSEEQQNRTQNENRYLDAMTILDPLNKEFVGVIAFNRDKLIEERDLMCSQAEEAKDLFQLELLRKTLHTQLNKDLEEERKRRTKLLYGLCDDTLRTPSIEDLVSCMEDTNYKRAVVNRDLAEAQENLEKKEDTIDQEYNTAMFEMLDESLSKVVHAFAAIETTKSFDIEQNRRMTEQPVNTSVYKRMDAVINQLKHAVGTSRYRK